MSRPPVTATARRSEDKFAGAVVVVVVVKENILCFPYFIPLTVQLTK